MCNFTKSWKEKVDKYCKTVNTKGTPFSFVVPPADITAHPGINGTIDELLVAVKEDGKDVSFRILSVDVQLDEEQ